MSAEGNPFETLQERTEDPAAFVGVDGAGAFPTPPGSYWCTP
ncbi:hypothetical protein [Halorientalis sp. IM1011]|nr:hypothetical protein [Halorientalis sp. IM1011]